MSKRQKVAYSGMGGEEPSFLKAFKARVGYQVRKSRVWSKTGGLKNLKHFRTYYYLEYNLTIDSDHWSNLYQKEPDNEKDMEAKKAKLDQMLNDDSLPDELPQAMIGFEI